MSALPSSHRREANIRPAIPMFLSAFNNVDFPTLGIPTTNTFSSDRYGCSFAMSRDTG